jgi:PTS system fructose-specific IIC component/2-O-A-mannosyl-D-glycerate-specific PTS system IIC component
LKLTDVLLKDMVILDEDSFQTKDDLFKEMAQRFYNAGVTTSAEAFYKALYVREEEGPTVFAEYELAIPHGICDEVVRPGVGFVRLKEPMKYQSCGEEGMVKYIFMLAIEGGNSEARNEHLQILAQVARLMMHEDFRDVLATTATYESMVAEIENYTSE